MFSLLRLCFVFSGEIYATEWAVFVSVDITFYSFALSYLLDFSFLHHSCRRIFTVFYVTTMKHDRFGRILKWRHFLAAKSYFQYAKNDQIANG